MKKPELLAPVGNMECLYAAIEAGCDAVYLGGKTFGARNYAGNFNDEEIKEAIRYSHLYGVKVYVTVNTLVYESEVDSFIKYIDFLHQNNVDAVIVQDIGMLDLIRQTFPNLEIHASTQMHIHNLEGVKLLEELGVKRVVLARELSIQEIEHIKKNTSLEIEVFVHGALCVSYSGQCLMSFMIGGRSGNRGTCAQCCRMPYSLIDKDGKVIKKDSYLLSPKDLNSLSDIDKLMNISVDSFKIEGRMKRKEYVYAVISLYRRIIDEYIETGKYRVDPNDIEELMKIFHRGFTKGFLNNTSCSNFISDKPNHIGIEIGEVVNYDKNKKRVSIRLQKDLAMQDGIRILGKNEIGFMVTKIINNSDGIIVLPISEKVEIGSKVVKTTDYKQLKEIDKKINLRQRRVLIEGKVIAKVGKPLKLLLNDSKNQVSILGEIVQRAEKQPITEAQLKKNINRIQTSVYQFKNLELDMDKDIFIPVSAINSVRRRAIEMLNEKRLYKIPYKKGNYYREVLEYHEEKGYNVLITSLDNYHDLEKYKQIYIDDFKSYQKLKGDKKVIYRLPRVMNEYPEGKDYLIGELGSLYKYKMGYSDFSFNVVNSYSIAFLHSYGIKRITLSYELTDRQIEKMICNYRIRYHKVPNLEKIISSKPEVMISKYHMLSNYSINDGYLVDKFQNKFHLKEQDNIMKIYHYKTIKDEDVDKYFAMGITRLRIHL